MKKLIKKSIAALFAALCVSVLAINAFASENPTVSADGLHTCYIKVERNYDYAYEVLELVNEERAKEGSAPLTMNRELLDAAMLRAAETAVYYSHTRPDNSYFNSALPELIILENIAAGYETPETVMEGWMNSPGHAGTLLAEDFRSVGIGVVLHNDNYYWVQDFSFEETEQDCPKPQKETLVQEIKYLTNVTDNKVYPYTLTPDLSLFGPRFGDSGLEMCVGQTITARMGMFNPRCRLYSAFENNNLSWKIEGDCITMDSRQNVTALKVGSAVISATYEGITYSQVISVTDHDMYYRAQSDNTHSGSCEHDCGYSFVGDCIFDKGVIIQEATEDYMARIRYTCKTCGNQYTVNYLDAPTIKSANITSTGKIKLTWNKVRGAYEYKVYRATSKTGKYSPMKTVTGTSYTNTSAKPGKYYYYYVVAIGVDGTESKKSNIVGRTCDYARPAVTATNDAATGKPKLTWTAVEGATSYKVYRSTKENGTYSLMKTVKDGATSYIHANAVAGKKYYYKVKAYGPNSSATSAWAVVEARTWELPRPTVSITTSSGKPKVSWTAVTGATKYQIYRSTSKTGTYSLVKTTTAKYWKDTTAVKDKTYYYRVVAVHSNTNANSAKSVVKSIKCTK